MTQRGQAVAGSLGVVLSLPLFVALNAPLDEWWVLAAAMGVYTAFYFYSMWRSHLA